MATANLQPQFDWDQELPPETATEVYQSLLRSLQYKQGFGLYFVQCTRAQEESIVADLGRDLPQQRIAVLHLQRNITTIYDRVDYLYQKQPFDILVLKWLNKSISAFEDAKSMGLRATPHILNHLNQQRERFRNDFPARFVFLVSPSVVDYFIKYAPDFLDWRSGLFQIPSDRQT